MKKICLILWAFALGVLSPSAHAKLNVVATTPDLGAIAQQVGGDKISLTVLAKPTEDPHFVDAKPSFILKLNRADVLIEGGAELEIGWLPPLVEGSRNTKIASGAPGRVLCSQGVSLLEVPSTLDRSKGDIHAAGNPHFMTDPISAKIAAQHICEVFSQIDEKSAAAYKANLTKFTQLLDQKLADWQKALAPFKGKGIVAYHNMWPYFAQRFGLKIETFLEPKPGIPPTPAHLAEVIGKMKADKIRVIIVEPFQNKQTAEKVASETSAKVIDVTQFPGGVKGTEAGYIEMMDYIVKTIANALEATK